MSELCHHDWVGDDECAYCKCEELEERIAELEEQLKTCRNDTMERAAEMVAYVAKNTASAGYEGFSSRMYQIAEAIRKEIK